MTQQSPEPAWANPGRLLEEVATSLSSSRGACPGSVPSRLPRPTDPPCEVGASSPPRLSGAKEISLRRTLPGGDLRSLLGAVGGSLGPERPRGSWECSLFLLLPGLCPTERLPCVPVPGSSRWLSHSLLSWRTSCQSHLEPGDRSQVAVAGLLEPRVPNKARCRARARQVQGGGQHQPHCAH